MVDVATGEAQPGPSSLARTLATARSLHETLLVDAGWLVVASTAAMLVLGLLGVLMGWPRIANTLAGWHKAMSWGLLPLVVAAGSQVTPVGRSTETRIGPFLKRWVALHQNYDAPRQFQDVQLSGPFASFEHTHKILPANDGLCELEDAIEYQLPYGWLGDVCGHRLVERRLEQVFRYRHELTQSDLSEWNRTRQGTKMKILITGGTGLIGGELSPLLATQGHEVFRLTRGQPREANDLPWNPEAGVIPTARLEGLDAVVHLAAQAGIRHSLDDWGPQGGHDWPYWKHQMWEYVSGIY